MEDINNGRYTLLLNEMYNVTVFVGKGVLLLDEKVLFSMSLNLRPV